MAFAQASGYTNLNGGVFSPVIYSKQVQVAFRKSAVAEAITNSDYFGEIANMGDSVKIIKEPEISVSEYKRGTTIATQDLADSDFSLVVDKSNYFAFKMDDIESQQSHVNWMSMASDRAAYRLADQHDQEILGYMCGYKQSALHGAADTVRVAADIPGTKSDTTAGDDELLAGNKLDITDFGNISTVATAGDSIPLAARLPGATALSTATASPLAVLARMSRLLDQRNVSKQGRFVVVDPVFQELLADEDSRLLNQDWGQSGAVRNGLVLDNLHGFRVYVSNNLPSVGTGAGTTGTTAQATNYGVILAGHDSSVASASQINKVEQYRDPDSFADIVRGMNLYGRKILRPEGLITARYNAA